MWERREQRAELLFYVSFAIPILIEGAQGMTILPPFVYQLMFWGALSFIVWAVINYNQVVTNPVVKVTKIITQEYKDNLFRLHSALYQLRAELGEVGNISISSRRRARLMKLANNTGDADIVSETSHIISLYEEGQKRCLEASSNIYAETFKTYYKFFLDRALNRLMEKAK